jgi:hypothetical protein
MQKPSIGSALLTAGLIAAVAGSRPVSYGPLLSAAVADTTDVTVPWMDRVTMEPIRVVVPRDALYEAVTMEPIRVVIPRAESAAPEEPEASPRR